MTKIIAVINQKGGVGKTATTCHLAYCFAKKNKRTLLIDIDPSANASSFYVQGEPALTIKDFLLSREINPLAILPACQGDKSVDFLSILPSHIGLAMAEVELANRPFKETLLDRKLRSDVILPHFDYILIDCPPTLTTLTVNAMYTADFILIPVTYQKHALDGIADLFQILDEIKENQTYDLRIIRNQHDARKKTVNDFMLRKLEALAAEGLVLNTIIHQDEAVNRATLQGRTVFEHCPHTTAAPDYQNLTTELEGIFNG